MRRITLDKRRSISTSEFGLLGIAILFSSCHSSCASTSNFPIAPQESLQQTMKLSSSRIALESREVRRAIEVSSKPLLTATPSPKESLDETTSISPQVFTPSDRVWGSMLLPSEAVGKLYRDLNKKNTPFKTVLYGDSHTQGGYIGEAIAQTLRDRLNPSIPEAHQGSSHSSTLSTSGFVTVDHPIHSAFEVNTQGVWLRQNWLYRRDKGSFGPLGIAFATQDKDATVTLKSEGHQGLKITAYFERTGEELPFCLTSDQDHSVTSCHLAGELIEGEQKLGSIEIELLAGHSLTLSLSRGFKVGRQLLKKRERSRRSIKRQRARVRKRYPRHKRDAFYKRIKAPSYATDSRLIFPKKPYLQLLGFKAEPLNASHKKAVQLYSMGVRGATIWSPYTQADETLNQWIQSESPQLIALWFGTNTAARESGSLKIYEDRFRGLIQRLKAQAPQASCLIITPPDFGRRDRNCYLTKRQRRYLKRKSKRPDFLEELNRTRWSRVCAPDELVNHRKRGRHRFPVPEVKTDKQWETYRSSCAYRAPLYLESIVDLQKRVGLAEGCIVYDTLADMGGTGSMRSWACAKPDRWSQLDLVHLSPTGYRQLGEQIAEGILSVLETSPLIPRSLSDKLNHSESLTEKGLEMN